MGNNTDRVDDRLNLTLRIPPSTHERVVELAAKERRSLNNQIVFMLERDMRQSYGIDIPAEESE